MRRQTQFVVTLALLTAAVASAHAQLDVKACEGPLTKDVYQYMQSRRQQLAYLRLYADSSRKQRERDIGGNADIFGVKIGASEQSFEDEWHARYEREDLHYTRADDIKYVHAITSQRAYAAYETCLRTLVDAALPIRLAPLNASPTRVQIRVIARNPAGVANLKLKSTVTGGRVKNVPAGQLWKGTAKWPTNGERLIDVDWEPGAADMTISVQDDKGRGTAALTLYRAEGTARVQYAGQVESVTDTLRVGKTSPNNHNKRYDRDECDGAKDGWCLSRTVLRLDAAKGRTLRLPPDAFTCPGIAPGRPRSVRLFGKIDYPIPYVCHAYRTITGPTLSNEDRTVEVIIDSYSHATYWELKAAEIEMVSAGAADAWGPDPIWIGHDFVVLVPSALAQVAVLSLQIGNSQGLLKLSDETGTVGPYRVTRVTATDAGPLWAGQYRVVDSRVAAQ